MKKILIIDDDLLFARTLADALTAKRYNVSLAKDGEEGLKIKEAESPDLILLDLRMPKMGGLEFLKAIQAKSQSKGFLPTPILILSNLAGSDTISEGIALGVRGYIVKSDESIEEIVLDVEKTLLH